jgi:hypothetical protein
MLKPWTFCSLVVSSIYLFYLAAFSRMTIWHDATGYEKLGTLLSQGQWVQYFVNGPEREPLYTLLVAAAMLIAKPLAIPYTSVVMIIQVFLFLMTQMMMVILMSRLKVRDHIQAIIILYAAFSPSLTNFTFILWSDFTPAPLILAGVLIYTACWKKLMEDSLGIQKIVFWGMALAFVLTTLTLLKGVFELAGMFIILSFVAAVPALNRKTWSKWLVFVFTVIICFQGAINGYKAINWHFNHQYVLTDRGAWALYGNIARRMEPMTPHKWMAAAAVVPHIDFCTSLMGEDACRYWGSDTVSNQFGFEKMHELHAVLPASIANKTMIDLSVQSMLKNPLQAGGLGFLEGAKLLFWEYYTPTAYAVYPRWVQEIYGFRPAMLFLRTLLSILTVVAIGWAVAVIFRRRPWANAREVLHDDQFLLIFAMTVWIISYIIPYSFFFLFGRYALALAPLYLVLIAGFLNIWYQKPRQLV